ncbi:hypothetical protein GY541_004705 [Escherichia coli]|nr:hypothetical protein [Escherichia coli]
MTSCICAISQSLDGAAQQMPVVQAGLRIITHSRTTLKPSLSRYSMNASIDKIT